MELNNDKPDGIVHFGNVTVSAKGLRAAADALDQMGIEGDIELDVFCNIYGKDRKVLAMKIPSEPGLQCNACGFKGFTAKEMADHCDSCEATIAAKAAKEADIKAEIAAHHLENSTEPEAEPENNEDKAPVPEN